ncbi:MAG: lactate racemase domain-containing protein, partial [Clostridiales Family XIII bacterium]|nr:lactate racemase domain-containing protein [Clostridiales Family XIII bacterium]
MDPATDAQDDSKMVKNMESFVLREQAPGGISDEELALAIEKSIGDIGDSMRILLIVPDITRLYSKAGFIANRYYHLLKETCEVNLLVALGTHVPMTEAECAGMYGDIPFERFFMHNWRTDTVKLGLVPEEFVFDVSEGLVSLPVDVEVSRHLLDGYDLILSVGQVVPHEVIGMANHSKNILVGCGGASMINSSHMLGAYFGMERIMGLDHTPVRKVFDYACE